MYKEHVWLVRMKFMGKLRNACSILIRKFRGRDHVVGVVNIDVMLDVPKYENFFFSNFSTEDGECCCRIMHKFEHVLSLV
jgi:hypothetical protein